MKAFRKWWDKHRASVSPHTCQSACGENLAMLADKEVWRAALEMTLEAITERLKLVSYDDNINCVDNILADIEAELGLCRKVEYGDGNGYRKVCEDCPAKQECRVVTAAIGKGSNETKTG